MEYTPTICQVKPFFARNIMEAEHNHLQRTFQAFQRSIRSSFSDVNRTTSEESSCTQQICRASSFSIPAVRSPISAANIAIPSSPSYIFHCTKTLNHNEFSFHRGGGYDCQRSGKVIPPDRSRIASTSNSNLGNIKTPSEGRHMFLRYSAWGCCEPGARRVML